MRRYVFTLKRKKSSEAYQIFKKRSISLYPVVRYIENFSSFIYTVIPYVFAEFGSYTVVFVMGHLLQLKCEYMHFIFNTHDGAASNNLAITHTKRITVYHSAPAKDKLNININRNRGTYSYIRKNMRILVHGFCSMYSFSMGTLNIPHGTIVHKKHYCQFTRKRDS